MFGSNLAFGANQSEISRLEQLLIKLDLSITRSRFNLKFITIVIHLLFVFGAGKQRIGCRVGRMSLLSGPNNGSPDYAENHADDGRSSN